MNVFEKIAQESMIDELEKIADERTLLSKIKDSVSGKASNAKADAKGIYVGIKGLRAASRAKKTMLSRGVAPDVADGILSGVKSGLKNNIKANSASLIKNPLVYAPIGAAAIGGGSLLARKLTRKSPTVGQKLVAMLSKNKLGVGLGLGAGALGAAALVANNK